MLRLAALLCGLAPIVFVDARVTEEEFAAAIDCRFPYHDRTQWRPTIERGRAISRNAAFMVLEEICRPPQSAAVTTEVQRELLLEWQDGFVDPLAEAVVRCAIALIDRQPLRTGDVIRIMDVIARDRGQYSALNIAYFAGPDEEDDVERRYAEIIEAWAKSG